jgi:hypothetical protein
MMEGQSSKIFQSKKGCEFYWIRDGKGNFLIDYYKNVLYQVAERELEELGELISTVETPIKTREIFKPERSGLFPLNFKF